MTIHYKIYPDLNCVFIEHSDDLMSGQITQRAKLIFARPEFHHGMNFLHDASRVKFIENPVEQSVSDTRTRIKTIDDPQIGNCRIAWLVGSAEDYRAMHRISVSNRFNDVVRQPFREMEKALAWLDLPLDFEFDRAAAETIE